MCVYSVPALGMQPAAENIPTAHPAAQVDKKSNRRRQKSPYRDARFRLMFQGLADVEVLDRSERTSVSRSVGSGAASPTSTPTPPTPSLTPLQLHSPSPAQAHASTSSLTYYPEYLTPERQAENDLFWRPYEVPTPGLPQHRTPAPWRDLSDVWRFEWFHHAMRLSGPLRGFTLNFSPEVEAQIRHEPKSAKWLADRMSRNLKDVLGYRPNFWFAFDVTENRTRPHTHGEIAASEEELALVRQAMRFAGGEWEHTRQHQVHTTRGGEPDVGWVNYMAKNRFHVRPHSPRFQALPRPINGDWYFAVNEVRSLAEDVYTSRLNEFISLYCRTK